MELNTAAKHTINLAAIAVILLFMAHSLAAKERRTIDIDLKGGFALSLLSGEHTSIFDTDSTSAGQDAYGGFAGALSFTAHSWHNKYFAVQPEIMFTHTGMKKTGNRPGSDIPGFSFIDTTDTTKLYTEERYRFYHLRLPVLYHFKFPFEKVKPSIYLGPMFGVNVHSTYEVYSEDGLEYEVDMREREDESVVNITFGVAAGTQVKVPLGPGHIVADLRYQQDLRNAISDRFMGYDIEGEEVYDAPESKAMMIVAMFGYGFAF